MQPQAARQAIPAASAMHAQQWRPTLLFNILLSQPLLPLPQAPPPAQAQSERCSAGGVSGTSQSWHGSLKSKVTQHPRLHPPACSVAPALPSRWLKLQRFHNPHKQADGQEVTCTYFHLHLQECLSRYHSPRAHTHPMTAPTTMPVLLLLLESPAVAATAQVREGINIIFGCENVILPQMHRADPGSDCTRQRQQCSTGCLTFRQWGWGGWKG